MKNVLISLIALVLFASVAVGQANQTNPRYLNPVKWYDESGNQVHKFTNTSSTAATGDTIVSECIPLDADEYKFGIYLGVGDTGYFNICYQMGTGAPTGLGFYSGGGIAMSAKVDSVISLGLRQQIVGQTGKLQLTSNLLPIGHTSTPGGYQSNRDSTWTNTFPSSINTGSYTWFRIVLIPHNINDVSNSTLLDKAFMIIRRYY